MKSCVKLEAALKKHIQSHVLLQAKTIKRNAIYSQMSIAK